MELTDEDCVARGIKRPPSDNTNDDTSQKKGRQENVEEAPLKKFNRRTLPIDDSVNPHLQGTHIIERLIIHARECIDSLNCTMPSNKYLEDMVCVIYESMQAPTRTFHTVSHICDICIGADSIQKLAAFFHDVVYYQIDGGLSDAQKEKLHDVISEKDDKVTISEDMRDANIKLVMDIFGFKSSQVLNPFKGLNEFLSACLAVRFYEKFMSTAILTKIAACIELTIPFRPIDDNGKTPAEALFDRLEKINQSYELGMNESELVETVQRAAGVGNRDVDNFSTTNRAFFLSNTWNLLPESNMSLRSQSYRVSDLVNAMKKMTDFFEFLRPEVIFMSFRDDKAASAEVKKKTTEAKENIDTALKYLRWKLLSSSILLAIAKLSGGDAPLPLFVGDRNDGKYRSRNLTDYFDIQPATGFEHDPSVLELLREGRELDSKFDIRKSPLAAYLYVNLGENGLKERLCYLLNPMNEGNSLPLLKSIPLNISTKIIEACAHICVTRTAELSQLIKTLQGTPKS